MPNRYRGETEAELSGKSYTLCLTLGTLAELEAAFSVCDIASLAKRFEHGQLSARDLQKIIACGLRGGGHDISDDEVSVLKVRDGLQGYVRIAAELLAATFGQNEAEADVSPVPPTPQDA